MSLQSSLEQFGLHENQIKVYLILLQLGEATIQEITMKSKVKRTTVYKALDNLVMRGLVTCQDNEWHRKYCAENPKKALLAVKEEQLEVVKKENRLLELMPELTSLYNSIPAKPKIRFYEGIDGLKLIYEETLLLQPNSEILTITPADIIHAVFDEMWVEDYLLRRVKGEIRVRSIAEDSAAALKHHENDAKELRESILVLKEKFRFKNEIYIFDNKVAIISPREQMGIIIESIDVSDTQRAFFELAWMGANSISSR